MTIERLDDRATKVRYFNRFYTDKIGVLHEHLLDSAFSLTELRILYELAHRPTLTAADLARELSLNPGYLSRVISGFEKNGLLERARSETDGRVAQLHLTELGRATYAPLDEASQREVAAMLERLSLPEQQQLVDAMRQIESLLGQRDSSYLLRDPRPGDMGWVVHRHGVLYAQDYGWNVDFEALVADIVAKYIRDFDSSAERCWIAEKDGKVVGSVFVVRHDETTAKLRLLYVEPSARGMGIGRRLVQECLRFAKFAGYQRMLLWTNSVLTGARDIYAKEGFEKIAEDAHHSFGKDLIGETWARDLRILSAPAG
ncbi:Histone acetyltransferase HPA2 -related acetyltransferase [Collimonas arenae]|uniref:Histone acetyltransferase HPA2-related acetyltransferase n=1 Tax=Collimonas arenae TaxID=279058 RepID=A0A0A1FAD5_9BURK|nr:bifunctional helix-turn-helix transcriptional regulator/GNAT family N-acetyltransferase [Collimonas arenae]AIY40730.1 Histone acetyltransferase HPA2 -related acetyltransferase [Collimonas arenae]